MNKAWIIPALAGAVALGFFLKNQPQQAAQASVEPLPAPRTVVKVVKRNCPPRPYYAQAPMYEDEEPAQIWYPVQRRQRTQGNVTTSYRMEYPDE